MKTLIIHPKDRTTNFLEIVYRPIPDKSVVTGEVSKKQLKKLMKEHDRIMMMGHGSPYGLFSMGQFDMYPRYIIDEDYPRYIIDEDVVSILKTKKNNVFIWCNADKFVENHDLKGFYSGMFISETKEANFCGVYGVDQNVIDQSNYGFCEILSKHITNVSEYIHENVKNEYSLIAERNSVAEYNLKRLYFK